MHARATGLSNKLYSEETLKKVREKAKERTGKSNPNWKGFISMHSMNNGDTLKFETLKEAEEWIKNNTKYKKASQVNISRVCNGKQNYCYGYVCKYQNH